MTLVVWQFVEVRISAKNKDLDLGIQAFGFECKKAWKWEHVGEDSLFRPTLGLGYTMMISLYLDGVKMLFTMYMGI